MRLSPICLLTGIAASSVAGTKFSTHHALSTPWISSPEAAFRSAHLATEDENARFNIFATPTRKETLKRDLSSAPLRRRKHRIHGASKEKGTWRKLIGLGNANQVEHDRIVSNTASNILIEPSGHRKLQSEHIALQICQESIPYEEEIGAEYGTICRCTPDFIERSATLECRDSDCTYCNSDETVCTGYAYGVVFDKDGVDVEFFEEDAYRLGHHDGAIRYTEKEESCSVSIDSQECANCVLQDCPDGHVGINVSCDNVEIGAAYDSCSEAFTTDGIFQAYNDNEFEYCYGNLDLCELGLAAMDPRFECSCNADPSNPDKSLLKCQDACEYCNEFMGVCGQEGSQQTYQSAMLTGTKRTVQYTSGRSEYIEYEELNCDATTGCKDCTFKVDGVNCESCTIQTCSDGTTAPTVQCKNIDDSLDNSVDLCAPASSLSGSILEFFEMGFTDSCVPKKELACREAKIQYEQHENKYSCDCVDQLDGTMELQCEATCGELCNDEESVCVREALYQDFLNEGASSYFKKDVKYTQGRKETLTYTEFIDGLCSMKIDGVECSSCVVNACPGNPQVERAPRIDCTQFDGGAILDLCDTEVRVESGIFERFSSMNEFQGCLDRTPANGICETNVRISNLPQAITGTTLFIPYDGAESCGSTQSFAPGLWYTVVGNGTGIEASVCEPEADFDAHISIYSGLDCKNLECTGASENACKIDWLGEKGTTYYIRVHGVGGQIGNFNLLLSDVNYGSVECELAKASFENNPDLETSCRPCEAPDADGHIHLHCSIDCNTCDESGSICANQTVSTKFAYNGSITLQHEHYEYVSGRDEYLTVTKYDCSSSDDCHTCEVSIDENVCESCEILACEEGQTRKIQGILAQCGNSTVNTCEEAKLDTSDILHPLVDSTYDKCFSRDAMAACLDHKAFEQDLEGGIFCDCEFVGESSDTRLVCLRQSCLHCNQERNICGYDAFGSIFEGQLGRLTNRFEGFQYIQGRDDLVAYHVSNDVAQADGSCQMTVNDVACDACIVSDCGETEMIGQFNGVTFDCQNVEGGLFYNGCSMISLPGTFEFINSPAFDTCVDVENPKKACEALAIQTMIARSRKRDHCSCHMSETGFYDLACIDEEGCRFCTDDSATVCADYIEHRNEINHFGSVVARVESYQWESGRDDLLVIRDNKIECQVTVNGEPCSSCEYIGCGDGSRRKSIDCSNVVGTNATFECGVGHEIFTPISDSAYYICPGDTVAPTSAPTSAPTKIPATTPTKETFVGNDSSSQVAARECWLIALTLGSVLASLLLY